MWLSTYFLSRIPSLCVDTSRAGKVYQMVMHKPNEISQVTREADWISTIVWSSARQGSLLPPASTPGALPRACDMRQVITRDSWWLLLRCFALHPEDPKCVVWRCGFFFGTFSKCMSIFLRDSLNKASPEGCNLLLQIPISYFRKSN